MRTLQRGKFQIPKSTLVIKVENMRRKGARFIVNSGSAKASATHDVGIAINHIVEKWIKKIESFDEILQGRLPVCTSIGSLVQQLKHLQLSPISSYVMVIADVASFYDSMNRESIMDQLTELNNFVESPIDVKFVQQLIQAVTDLEVFEAPKLRSQQQSTFFRRLTGLSTGCNYAPSIAKLFFLAKEIQILQTLSSIRLPSYSRIVSMQIELCSPSHVVHLHIVDRRYFCSCSRRCSC